MTYVRDPFEDPSVVVWDPADLFGSLQDRLLFRQAQGLLAGLCGCSERRAAHALLSTAARHGVAGGDIGAWFLAALDSDPLQQPRVDGDGDAEKLVISVVEAALSPYGGLPSQRGSPPADQPDLLRCHLVVMPDERAWWLVVEGELDLASGPSLAAVVTELCRVAPSSADVHPRLLLDLSAVTFIDVCGVRALNDLHAHLSGLGGVLDITPPVGRGPGRLLRYAVRAGWLAPGFAPGDPTHEVLDDIAGPTPPNSRVSRRR